MGIYAQQSSDEHHYTDSLEAVLRKPLNATTRAKTLFLLSQYWADLDSAKGVRYAQKALEFNAHTDYDDALGHYYMGQAYFEYNSPKAQEEYMLAEQKLRNLHTQQAYLLLSKAWHNYGALQERNGNEKSFADILLTRVIPLATKAGDTKHVGIYYMSLGVVFMNVFDYDKSISYYKKAATIFKSINPTTESLLNCYSKIAENYTIKENYPAAKPFLDSAKTLVKLYPLSIHTPSYYLCEGRYYNAGKNWDKAFESFNKGIQVAEHLNRLYDVTTIMMEQYQTYKARKKYPEAKEILLNIYHKPYVTSMPENTRLVLRELASTDSALNNPKAAYQWLRQFTELTDSLFNVQNKVQITGLEARYNYAEKEKEVLRLNNKSKLERLMLWGSLGLFLLAMILFIYFYKQRKTKAEQQLQSLRQQQQIAVAQALLEGEERERGRLARDLHDGLGGMLAGIKINLSEMADEENPTIAKAIHQLDGSVTELRRIARNLMPEALLRSGLEAALNDLCELTSTDKINVELQVMDINRNLPVQIQVIIYRIVQELMANTIKHASATEVFLQCSQHENVFHITMEDNGKGFDEKALSPDKKGIGLDNIRSRVEFLQGKMDIHSSPGKGTSINIELQCGNQSTFTPHSKI